MPRTPTLVTLSAPGALTISGFMVLKNAVSLGYPFLEAIASALPICDEFLISDGYSQDATWDALQVLRDKYPAKIKLFKDQWRSPANSGEVIAVMTNVLLERCSGTYCLYVQGNEILHEASREELRQLPRLYPDIEMFKLPFYNLMGAKLLWLVDFRRRLFKREPYIKARGDGYDVGYDPRALVLQPRKLLDSVLRGKGERIHYLPEPFYRYRALFPASYLRKLDSRRDLNRKDRWAFFWNKEYCFAKMMLEEVSSQSQAPEVFWSKMRAYFDEAMWKDLPPGLAPSPAFPRCCIREMAARPTAIAHLLNQWDYDLQKSLDFLSSLTER